tara:strand:- start:19 stop:621 length:603 start_codon:yes stop_codon:yes gene_type:complete
MDHKYPTGLKTAQEIFESTKLLSVERLIELSKSGYLPHYLVDNNVYLYNQAEVRRWIDINITKRNEGKNFPDVIRLNVPALKITDNPPKAIWNVPHLQQIPKYSYQTGVYFLCKDDEVVYVGQSINPAVRISTHSQNTEKNFDRVYLMPVPESELDDVEGSFIHHLQPSQQGGVKIGRKAIGPKPSIPIKEVFAKYQIEV